MGRDARGRLQYRYHAAWTRSRDATKFDRSIAFARALPRLRRRVARDLQRRGMPREKVLAAVVRLLDRTLIRVGNEEYARTNESFGLTTLRNRHVKPDRHGGLRLTFKGKSGKQHEVGLNDRRLVRVIRACQELPGQRLFQYRDDDGAERRIESRDVNDYIRDSMGADFSAKDFRTWAATVLAEKELATADSIPAAVKAVAQKLGNTPAVCRRSYINPIIIEAAIEPRIVRDPPDRPRGLDVGERAVLALLERRRERPRRRRAA
jgi:DNA topoisomerase-1